jgi:hypothetical protein
VCVSRGHEALELCACESASSSLSSREREEKVKGKALVMMSESLDRYEN